MRVVVVFTEGAVFRLSSRQSVKASARAGWLTSSTLAAMSAVCSMGRILRVDFT
jgi:uncharacterized protein (UPF0210 family)